MSEYPMHLPIAFSHKRNKFEETLIESSNKIFNKPIPGIIFALINNAVFLYFCYYKRPFFYMFIFCYLLILISHIIFFQFGGNK